MNLCEFTALETRVSLQCLLLLQRQRPQAFLNDEELVYFILSGEQWLSVDQLSHDSSNGPHINRTAVLSSNQQLGWSVPASGHVISEGRATIHPCLSGKAEVAYFQLVLLANQNVLRLDVAMEQANGVEMCHSPKQLVGKETDSLDRQSFGRLLDDLQQIFLEVLEDKIGPAFFPECFFEWHYIGMAQPLEYPYLPRCYLLAQLVIIILFKLLDGHYFPRIDHSTAQHHSICAFSDRSQDLVLLHDVTIDKKPTLQLIICKQQACGSIGQKQGPCQTKIGRQDSDGQMTEEVMAED